MDIKTEKAQLLKRLAEIEVIEKQANITIEDTAKRMGYKSGKELLAAIASPRWEDEPKPKAMKSAKSKPTGRRANLTQAEKDKIKAAYKNRKEGETAASVAKKFGIAEPTLFRVLNPLKKK